MVPDLAPAGRQLPPLFLHVLAEMLAATGLEKPLEFKPKDLERNINTCKISLFLDLHQVLKLRELLSGSSESEFHARM